MFLIKEGVKLLGVKPHTVAAMQIAGTLYYSNEGRPLVITSVKDGSHDVTGGHATGEAFDIRSKSFSGTTPSNAIENKKAFVTSLQQILGDQWLVLLEGLDTPNEHIHVQLKQVFRT